MWPHVNETTGRLYIVIYNCFKVEVNCGPNNNEHMETLGLVFVKTTRKQQFYAGIILHLKLQIFPKYLQIFA